MLVVNDYILLGLIFVQVVNRNLVVLDHMLIHQSYLKIDPQVFLEKVQWRQSARSQDQGPGLLTHQFFKTYCGIEALEAEDSVLCRALNLVGVIIVSDGLVFPPFALVSI